MPSVSKAFPNRSLPEHPYTRLFRCRKCGHYMLYNSRILPGSGCLNCGSTGLSCVASRTSARLILRDALILLLFSAGFALCELLLAAVEAPGWLPWVLAAFFVLFLACFILLARRNHPAMLFDALVREFEANASMLRSSYDLSAEELGDSLTSTNAVEVYLALREMSFVCDSDALKRTRLRALEYIPKTPLLDFETDELIPSDIDPYSDAAEPDIALLRYLRIARRLSPHKIGPASEAILSSYEDVSVK